MKIVSGKQMKEIDKASIELFGIPSIVLMEHAALKVAEACIKAIEANNYKKVLIFAGKGNNGGDGFAEARILFNKGYNVEVFFLGNLNDISGDALINFNIIKKLGIKIYSDVEKADIVISHSHIIIDAMLGTGIKGEVKEPFKSIINKINEKDKYIISVDIPSGIDSDTGKVLGCAIKADETITFALNKIGLLLYEGAEHAGNVTVADISIPKQVIQDMDIKSNCLNHYEASKLLPKRKKRSNKGTYGRLFIFAGSKNMTGAASFCAKGAYRAGAGVVYSCIPEICIPVMQKLVPEAVEISLNHKNGFVCKESFYDIKEEIKKASAFIIGCGIGFNKDVKEFVNLVLPEFTVPFVIDADGLNVISHNLEILKNLNTTAVVTPHIGEMSRLTGKSIDEILSDTVNTALNFAKEYNVVTVLKDARTIIASPKGEFYINLTGNNAMAKAGSGDILSGIIGGFLAQGMDCFNAAVLSVYIHGMAGDFAARNIGEYSLFAQDILDFVPEAFNELS